MSQPQALAGFQVVIGCRSAAGLVFAAGGAVSSTPLRVRAGPRALHCTKPGRAEIWPGCFNSETVDREHEPELVSLSAGRLPSAQTAP